jgi:hypothetical protein
MILLHAAFEFLLLEGSREALRDTSPLETDLSDLPIVPPIEPACVNAVGSVANNAAKPQAIVIETRQITELPPMYP